MFESSCLAKKKIADIETLAGDPAENPRKIFQESKDNGRILVMGSKEKCDRNQQGGWAHPAPQCLQEPHQQKK